MLGPILSFVAWLQETPLAFAQTGAWEDIKTTLHPVEIIFGANGLLQSDAIDKLFKNRVAAVANIFLGLTTLVLILLLMYGGTLWMTARGNEQQVAQAKKIIREGIFGVIIILLAGVITNFVIYNVYQQTVAH